MINITVLFFISTIACLYSLYRNPKINLNLIFSSYFLLTYPLILLNLFLYDKIFYNQSIDIDFHFLQETFLNHMVFFLIYFIIAQFISSKFEERSENINHKLILNNPLLIFILCLLFYFVFFYISNYLKLNNYRSGYSTIIVDSNSNFHRLVNTSIIILLNFFIGYSLAKIKQNKLVITLCFTLTLLLIIYIFFLTGSKGAIKGFITIILVYLFTKNLTQYKILYLIFAIIFTHILIGSIEFFEKLVYLKKFDLTEYLTSIGSTDFFNSAI